MKFLISLILIIFSPGLKFQGESLQGSCALGAGLAVRLYVRYCSCNGESFIMSNYN